MKILQVKINSIVSEDIKENIRMDIKRSILDGFVVHDNTVELNVLEFDDVEVKE